MASKPRNLSSHHWSSTRGGSGADRDGCPLARCSPERRSGNRGMAGGAPPRVSAGCGASVGALCRPHSPTPPAGRGVPAGWLSAEHQGFKAIVEASATVSTVSATSCCTASRKAWTTTHPDTPLEPARYATSTSQVWSCACAANSRSAPSWSGHGAQGAPMEIVPEITITA